MGLRKKDQQFITGFENKIKDTIDRYSLIKKNDKVIVACSGGKDSTTTLYILNKLGYKVEALIIDLLMGTYSRKNLENITEFCNNHKIKLHIISLRDEFSCSICYLRSGIQEKKDLHNCLICGIIKRWLLNKKSRELKADKIATGHNMDDESETILMNFLKGNPELSAGLGPKTGILKDPMFIDRIKPLYFCKNSDVRKYSEIMDFPVIYEPCPCSVNVFRREIRKQLSALEKVDPKVKENIISFFLGMLPAIKKSFKSSEKLRYCTICGEPSRKDVCMRCSLINLMNDKSW